MNRDLPFYVALAASPGIGPARFKVLLSHFKTAESVWNLPEKTLEKVLPKDVFGKFIAFRKAFDPENYLEKILSKNIQITISGDKNYPKLLKEIFDPPPVLYIKGELPKSEKTIGVVGTRKITVYGKQVTESLVRGLVNNGFVIVSGLARGVDSFAHKVTVENGGKTIAVLGGGLDLIYPPENVPLANKIVETGGAVLSEFPLGMNPVPGNFPARNRIISGLSLGILVTEAGEDSGSLITAGQALEQGREVFAVPGPIYSKLSVGPARLIKDGAKLVTSVEDILEELNLDVKFKTADIRDIQGETQEEQVIIDLLKEGPVHVDELARKSRISSAVLGSILSMMEIRGKIKALSSGIYSLNS
jgi:DNA processing protein